MSRTYRAEKTRKQPRRISARGIRRASLDTKKLSRALMAHALQQAAEEAAAAAERREERSS